MDVSDAELPVRYLLLLLYGLLVLQTKAGCYLYLLYDTGTLAIRVDIVRPRRVQHTFIYCVVVCVYSLCRSQRRCVTRR